MFPSSKSTTYIHTYIQWSILPFSIGDMAQSGYIFTYFNVDALHNLPTSIHSNIIPCYINRNDSPIKLALMPKSATSRTSS